MIEEMVSANEKYGNGKRSPTNRNALPVGAFINACSLVSPQPYLKDYMLTFDINSPANKDALIATLT